MKLSVRLIDALAEIITGGSGNSSEPPIGVYRSAWELTKFMRGCGLEFAVSGSRVPSLIDALTAVNDRPDAGIVWKRIVESAADPRDFIKDPEKLSRVVDYLNQFLAYEGLTLERSGLRIQLVQRQRHGAASEQLTSKLGILDFDTVSRDFQRAHNSMDEDPEDAITGANSAVESVCRSILLELSIPLPRNKDVQGLYRAVREPLGLSPEMQDHTKEITADVIHILGGLNTVVSGIGSLRTHAGDAHGREKGYRRVDERIARLSVAAAEALVLFLIETWEKKFPTKILHRR